MTEKVSVLHCLSVQGHFQLGQRLHRDDFTHMHISTDAEPDSETRLSDKNDTHY